MSQENIESFKRALEAGNRRDEAALLRELDPEVEWEPVNPAAADPEETVYRGHEGVREMWRDVHEAFPELHLEILEMRELDDRIVAICRVRVHGAESGIDIESPLSYLVQYRGGKAIRVRSYTDREEALEAAGLTS